MVAVSSSNSKNARTGGGHPLLTGILIGLLIGVGVSAGVAVWIARMPSPFQNRALDGAASSDAGRGGSSGTSTRGMAGEAGSTGAAALGATAPVAAGGAAGVGGGTAGGAGGSVTGGGSAPGVSAAGEAGGGVASRAVGADRATSLQASGRESGGSSAGSAAATSADAPAASSETPARALSGMTTWLQVGAFGSVEDADKQVETVAMLTGVRAVVLPQQQGEKTIYRVRLGPYRQRADFAELAEALKSNSISTTIVRVAADTP